MLDFDVSNLRDWMAGVGLLRLVSETTASGRLRWSLDDAFYRLRVDEAPTDLAGRCASWMETHRKAWHFAGLDNVNDRCTPAIWRQHAMPATGIEAALWCAIGSDAVLHSDGKKIQASMLEYAHGGGHQDWLGSLRMFVTDTSLTAEAFLRLFSGERHDRGPVICLWDAAQEREHAYLDGDPSASSRKPRQDVLINALAAVGLASVPSMPTRRGLVTPLVHGNGVLRWPVWTDALRIADLEAALLCSWTWPTMEGRRWNSQKRYCFSCGALREPAVTAV